MTDGCAFTSMMARGSQQLARVLTPFLGRVRARERSESMIRALLDGRGDPLTIASELLPELPDERRRRVAGAVAIAWISLEA